MNPSPACGSAELNVLNEFKILIDRNLGEIKAIIDIQGQVVARLAEKVDSLEAASMINCNDSRMSQDERTPSPVARPQAPPITADCENLKNLRVFWKASRNETMHDEFNCKNYFLKMAKDHCKFFSDLR